MSTGLSDAFYKSLLSTVSSDALTKLNFKYSDECSFNNDAAGITGPSDISVFHLSALVDCNKNISLCRVANPTNRPVFWPAGHAFAYLSTLPNRRRGREFD